MVKKIEDGEVLASRERASMASCWTECLRLTKIGNREAKLEICMYEYLAPRPYDDEGGDPVLPDQIDGKPVVGIDDDFIIGGELSCIDDRYFRFEQREVHKAVEWLAENHWMVTTEILVALRRAVGLSSPSRAEMIADLRGKLGREPIFTKIEAEIEAAYARDELLKAKYADMMMTALMLRDEAHEALAQKKRKTRR